MSLQTLLRSSGLAAMSAALLLGCPTPVAAQAAGEGRAYVSAGALFDLKRFSGNPATNVLDGEALGGSIAVGTSVAPRWDIEASIGIPRITTKIQPRLVTFQRTILTLQSRTRNRPTTMTALVRYRAMSHGRLQIGYLAGMTLVHLRREFDTEAPANTPDSLIPSPHQSVEYAAAPTVGLDARIAMTRHIALVPALRVSPFSTQDVSGVLVRPRIALRWTF